MSVYTPSSSSLASFSTSAAMATMCTSLTEQFAAISLSDVSQNSTTGNTTNKQTQSKLEKAIQSCFETFIAKENFDTLLQQQIIPSPRTIIQHCNAAAANDPLSLIFCTSLQYATSHRGTKKTHALSIAKAIQPYVNPQYLTIHNRTCFNLAITSKQKKIVLGFCKNKTLLNLDKEQMRVSVRMLLKNFDRAFLKKVISLSDLANSKVGILLSILIEENETDWAIALTKALQHHLPNWWQQPFQNSLFITACTTQNKEYVQFIIPFINPNERVSTLEGCLSLPITLVAKNGWVDCVQTLIKRGTDCRLFDSGRSVYDSIEEGCRENSAFVQSVLQNSNMKWLIDYSDLLSLIQNGDGETAKERIKRELKKEAHQDNSHSQWLNDTLRLSYMYTLALNNNLREIASLIKNKMEITVAVLVSTIHHEMYDTGIEFIQRVRNPAIIERSIATCDVNETFDRLFQSTFQKEERPPFLNAILLGLTRDSQKKRYLATLKEELLCTKKFLLLDNSLASKYVREGYLGFSKLSNQETLSQLLLYALEKKNEELALSLLSRLKTVNQKAVLKTAVQSNLEKFLTIFLEGISTISDEEVSAILTYCSDKIIKNLVDTLLRKKSHASLCSILDKIFVHDQPQCTQRALTLFRQIYPSLINEKFLREAVHRETYNQLFCDILLCMKYETRADIHADLESSAFSFSYLIDPSYYDKKRLHTVVALDPYGRRSIVDLIGWAPMHSSVWLSILQRLQKCPSFARAIAEHIQNEKIPFSSKAMAHYKDLFTVDNVRYVDVNANYTPILLYLFIFYQMDDCTTQLITMIKSEKNIPSWMNTKGIKEALFAKACENSQADIIAMLVDTVNVTYSGKNPITRQPLLSPIVYAIQAKATDIIIRLINRRANMNRTLKVNNHTKTILQFLEDQFADNPSFVKRVKTLLTELNPPQSRMQKIVKYIRSFF